MKVAVLSVAICPYTLAILDYFEKQNFEIKAVIIEEDIRKKFSESEIKFRTTHDKFNRKLKSMD